MIASVQKQPFFSVITPSFNRLALLRDALQSIFAQRWTNFETIVIDDGSEDGTLQYLRELRDRVKFFTQTNLGPGAARNIGAVHARGAYLAFLDSDDLWFPWTLDVYAKAIEDAKYPAFVAGKPVRFALKKSLPDVKEDSPAWLQFKDYLESGDQWRWWGVSSFVIRRDVFLDVNGFSAELYNGEDADLALRLGTASGFVQITAPETFAYREHPGNIAGDLHRNAVALQHQIRAESSGEYPGGWQRRRQRQKILTRHMRPVAIACTRKRMSRHAWQLYWSTLGWHIALRKWRFIGAFPLLALLGRVGRKSLT